MKKVGFGGLVTKMIEFTIPGQPYSKANSRIKTRWGGVIKSDNAMKYANDFYYLCPHLPNLLEGALRVDMLIWYSSFRSDVDESLILDCMQGLIYKNDRQVKDKRIKGWKDKENPRSIIRVREIDNIVMEFD